MKKLLIILSLFIIVFSCKEKKSIENDKANYIDVKIQSSREYTDEERVKIRSALERFNENVVIEDGQYVVKAKSGDEIGIPNEFFYIFKMGIDDTNELAREAENNWRLAEPNQTN